MNKNYIKICAVAICLSAQYSWGISWKYEADPQEKLQQYNNFGWRVYTVSVDKFNEGDSFTVNSVDGEIKTVAVKGGVTTFGPNITAEMKDLSCIGKTFTKIGDSCKFKARIPCDNACKATTSNISFDIKYFFTDKYNNKLLVYENPKYMITNLQGKKPLVRLANAEENKDYPVFGDTNNDYAVLVVENGGLTSFALSKVDIENPSSGNKILRFIPKTENQDLYGDNNECAIGSSLAYLRDSCIQVYRFENIPASASVLPSEKINVTIGGNKYANLAVAPVKPMKVVIGPITKNTSYPSYRLSWKTEVSVINAYGSDKIGTKIRVVDSTGNPVAAFFRSVTCSDLACKNSNRCILSSNNTTCNFTATYFDDGYALKSGTYDIIVQYFGDNIESGEVKRSFEN